MAESIMRDDLRGVIAVAAHGITPSTREKLLAIADTTGAVAVGWFHCTGEDGEFVRCPMRQIGRRTNQRFQEKFDREMALRFGRTYYEGEGGEHPAVHPFVVNVSDAPREERA